MCYRILIVSLCATRWKNLKILALWYSTVSPNPGGVTSLFFIVPSPDVVTTPTSAYPWCTLTPTARSPWKPSLTTPFMRQGWVDLSFSRAPPSLSALNSLTSKLKVSFSFAHDATGREVWPGSNLIPYDPYRANCWEHPALSASRWHTCNTARSWQKDHRKKGLHLIPVERRLRRAHTSLSSTP